jgi:hypothetical protein
MEFTKNYLYDYDIIRKIQFDFDYITSIIVDIDLTTKKSNHDNNFLFFNINDVNMSSIFSDIGNTSIEVKIFEGLVKIESFKLSCDYKTKVIVTGFKSKKNKIFCRRKYIVQNKEQFINMNNNEKVEFIIDEEKCRVTEYEISTHNNICKFIISKEGKIIIYTIEEMDFTTS